MAFTCQNYDYRYETASEQLTQVQIASSYSSLNAILMVMRDSTIEDNFNIQTKMTAFNANALDYYNLLINQIRFFDENIDSFEQFYNELKHLFPEAANSTFLTSLYTTTRFVCGIRIAACPEAFKNSITSGVKTAALSNNIVLQLHFDAAPSTLQRTDIFLNSDVLIDFTPNSRDLQIHF